MAATYPSGIQVFIDGIDITQYIFGTGEGVATDANNRWDNIDISTWVKVPGSHTLYITSRTPGAVDARIESN